jgi:histidinol-phosphatase (PHP family)
MTSPWLISLHGGHSGEFCDHAQGTLESVLEAAAQQGFATFGVSEHAPRSAAQLVYPEESEQGWTVETLAQKFAAYGAEALRLQAKFEGRLTVLRGFETEAAPATWSAEMQALREEHDFDFIVGSVHHVEDIPIDWNVEMLSRAADACGGLEALALRYYDLVAEVVEQLEPEVVGHLDLIRKLAGDLGPVDTLPIRERVSQVLELIAETDGILDLNVSPVRRGQGPPYCAPWILAAARRLSIPFCFGDDSHGPDEVGGGIREGRQYLLEHGIDTITTPDLRGGRRIVSLR